MKSVRQFHIQVAIELEERAGELAFATRQYTNAFHLPLFSPKKTQTSAQTCSIPTRSCPELLFLLAKLKSVLKEIHFQ